MTQKKMHTVDVQNVVDLLESKVGGTLLQRNDV